MKNFKSIFILQLIGILLLVSCSKSNEEEQVPNGGPGGGNNNCDTVNITFSAGVLPILKANCYSCHGNGQVNGGVNFDTYTGVKTVADNGRLIGAITHAQGYTPMPQGGTKLSNCNINKIKSWIARGTKDN